MADLRCNVCRGFPRQIIIAEGKAWCLGCWHRRVVFLGRMEADK